jgi:hypothetical protein
MYKIENLLDSAAETFKCIEAPPVTEKICLVPRELSLAKSASEIFIVTTPQYYTQMELLINKSLR